MSDGNVKVLGARAIIDYSKSYTGPGGGEGQVVGGFLGFFGHREIDVNCNYAVEIETPEGRQTLEVRGTERRVAPKNPKNERGDELVCHEQVMERPRTVYNFGGSGPLERVVINPTNRARTFDPQTSGIPELQNLARLANGGASPRRVQEYVNNVNAAFADWRAGGGKEDGYAAHLSRRTGVQLRPPQK